MSTSSKERAILSGLAVMTMSVEELPVFHIIGSARNDGHDVVVFPDILRCKDESTTSAFAPLLLEQYRDTLWKLRVCARPACPVEPVAIEDAFGASYFDVPFDRGLPIVV